MFTLRSTKGDNSVYYLRKELTTVGRQEGDIILKDQAVSRKHAHFIVKDNELALRSLKDQLRTFVNNKTIDHSTIVKLSDGDIVKMGFNYEFRVESKKLCVLTSSLPEDKVSELRSYIKKIPAEIVYSFKSDVTHLVITEFSANAKIICGVIMGVPIVTVDFFKEYARCLVSNIRLPKEEDFRPNISSSISSSPSSYFEYNENRKTLFKDKSFVFTDEKLRKKMKTLIALAGGKHDILDPALIFEYQSTSLPVTYVIVHSDTVDGSVKVIYDDICTTLRKAKWRPIPVQEIATALLKCSCEIECNPSFNRGGNLLKALVKDRTVNTEAPLASSTQITGANNRILAPATQTQLMPSFTKPDLTIPPSLDTNPFVSQATVQMAPTQEALARRRRHFGMTQALSEAVANDKMVAANDKMADDSGGCSGKMAVNDSILSVVSRKSGPRSDEDLENPVKKKMALQLEDDGDDDFYDRPTSTPATSHSNLNKRKSVEPSVGTLSSVKTNPFASVQEPVIKKQRSIKSYAHETTTVASLIGEINSGTDSQTSKSSDDITASQQVSNFFASFIKPEPYDELTALLNWTSINLPKRQKQEDEVEVDLQESESSECAVPVAQVSVVELETLMISRADALLPDYICEMNFKAFRKTQHAYGEQLKFVCEFVVHEQDADLSLI